MRSGGQRVYKLSVFAPSSLFSILNLLYLSVLSTDNSTSKQVSIWLLVHHSSLTHTIVWQDFILPTVCQVFFTAPPESLASTALTCLSTPGDISTIISC